MLPGNSWRMKKQTQYDAQSSLRSRRFICKNKANLLIVGEGHVTGAEGVVPGEFHYDRGDDEHNDGDPHRSVLPDDEADRNDVERKLPNDSDGDVEGVTR